MHNCAGVFSGNSINKAAQYRKKYCETEEKVYGFDTFSGEPMPNPQTVPLRARRRMRGVHA